MLHDPSWPALSLSHNRQRTLKLSMSAPVSQDDDMISKTYTEKEKTQPEKEKTQTEKTQTEAYLAPTRPLLVTVTNLVRSLSNG